MPNDEEIMLFNKLDEEVSRVPMWCVLQYHALHVLLVLRDGRALHEA